MRGTLTRHATIAVLATVAVAGGIYAAGLRVNRTASLPLGIYWRTFAPLDRGSYVIFCPPADNSAFALARERHYIDYGNCKGRFATLLKRVVGLPGDQIDVDADGVRVNGVLLRNSAPLAADRGGHALPIVRLHTNLPPQKLLLMSDYTPWSFDGRYFGLIPESAIQARVKPVWTW